MSEKCLHMDVDWVENAEKQAGGPEWEPCYTCNACGVRFVPETENAQLKARVAELETALGGLSHGFAPDEGPHADLYSADERRPCFCPWHRHTEATHTPQCLAARAALTGARKEEGNELG